MIAVNFSTVAARHPSYKGVFAAIARLANVWLIEELRVTVRVQQCKQVMKAQHARQLCACTIGITREFACSSVYLDEDLVGAHILEPWRQVLPLTALAINL